jgi:hypothetical protein
MDPLPFDEIFYKLEHNNHYTKGTKKLIVIYDQESPPSFHAKNKEQWRLYIELNKIDLDFQDQFIDKNDIQEYLSKTDYKGYIVDFTDNKFLLSAIPQKRVVGQVKHQAGTIRLYLH